MPAIFDLAAPGCYEEVHTTDEIESLRRARSRNESALRNEFYGSDVNAIVIGTL